MAAQLPAAAKWASAAELVAKVSGIRTLYGAIITSANEVIKDQEEGLYGRKFHSQFKFTDFEVRKTSDLTADFFNAAKRAAYNELSLYDFVIVGPRSEYNKFSYEVPGKTLPTNVISNGELQNVRFQTQTVEYEPLLNNWSIRGKTSITFSLARNGRFIFQFTGLVREFKLNGKVVSKSDLIVIPQSSPMMSPIYIYQPVLNSDESYIAEISFNVGSGTYTIFNGNESKLLIFETRFDNRYGLGPQTLFPTINLPSTRPQLTLHFKNTETFSSRNNAFISNGIVGTTADGISLDYGRLPSQQIFFQSRPKVLKDSEFTVSVRQGLTAQIKMNHFFLDHEFRRTAGKWPEARAAFEAELVKPLGRVVVETVQKMDSLFGPYPHCSNLIINVHPEFDGESMEYAGALNTGLNSTIHEIIHQWFATSVKPRTNADSWMMEAITTWIETTQFERPKNRFDGFRKARAENFQSGPEVAIDAYRSSMTEGLVFDSKYCPSTQAELCEGFSFQWYRIGLSLMHEIDKSLKSGSGGRLGLSGALRAFYAKHRGGYAGPSEFAKVLAEQDPSTNWHELLKFGIDQK